MMEVLISPFNYDVETLNPQSREPEVEEFSTPLGDIQLKTGSLADTAETLDRLRKANRELMLAQRRVQELMDEAMERGLQKIEGTTQNFVDYDILSLLLTGPKSLQELSRRLAIPRDVLLEHLYNLEKRARITRIDARTYWFAR